jgi:hypothetical protein
MVKHTFKVLQAGFRLVVRDFVTSLIDPGETEVAILANLTILNTIDEEGSVSGSAKSLRIGEVGSQ